MTRDARATPLKSSPAGWERVPRGPAPQGSRAAEHRGAQVGGDGAPAETAFFLVSSRRGEEPRKRGATGRGKPGGRRSRFAEAQGTSVPQEDIALAGPAGPFLVLTAAVPSLSCQAFTAGRPAGGRGRVTPGRES